MDKIFRNFVLGGVYGQGKAILSVLMFVISLLFFSVDGLAVPAAPVIHTLTQPDGTVFKARQWVMKTGMGGKQ